MNVYFLGPENTFSHRAASHLFATGYTLIPCASFAEIFSSVQESSDSFAVIPFENSITSNVHENIDRLFHSPLKIIGELFVQIHLNLLAPTGVALEDIQKVYSHPKAFEQCKKICSEHNWEKIVARSTTGAASMIAPGSLDEAAIVPASLAAPAEMTLLKKNIEDISHNFTRFLILAQTELTVVSGTKNKCSMTFKVKHEEGALLSVLEVLRDHKANMTKLTSRPIPGTDWEYLFWIDFELAAELSDALLHDMSSRTLEYRIVGKYPTGKQLD